MDEDLKPIKVSRKFATELLRNLGESAQFVEGEENGVIIQGIRVYPIQLESTLNQLSFSTPKESIKELQDLNPLIPVVIYCD